MARHNAVDAESRGTDYRSAGWERFDPSTETTTPTTTTAAAGMGTAAGLGTTTAGGMMGGRTTSDPRSDAAMLGSGAQAGPSSGLGRDGTPGNPPGTMASRAVDDVAGTNISGARPENELSRGSTASSTSGMATGLGGAGAGSRDGTPGNPPGTMVSRGIDQAAGTNISGAYPGNERTGTTGSGMAGSSQPDGTPGNPPGTMASRAVDDVAGTNISGARPENEKPTTVRTPRGPGR